jgi:predicted DNA-binding transcriptional regulator YafY
MTPRERAIRVLLRILSHPYRYTKRDLAEHFEVSKDTIKEDIIAIQNTGLHFEQDSKYRCAVIPDRQFKELKHLQSLTEDDRFKIGEALNHRLSSKDALYLKNKLASLYNFQQLGLRALRRPALERIDALEKAKKLKLRVVLEKYKSNSNSIRDRLVEPFHIDPELDTLQAFDVDSDSTRHFKLSRIERVKLMETPWSFEPRHEHKYTDVFRIANNHQVPIHLRLQVYAYNALIEAYPKALSEVMPGAESETFDFETKVNCDFLGLMNFIMGNFKFIEIIAPQQLKDRVEDHAKEILEKMKKD